MEVEDEVQLADIAEVAVQHLHKLVDDLQGDQLVVGAVHAHHKVQAGIPLVDHLQTRRGVRRGNTNAGAMQMHRCAVSRGICMVLGTGTHCISAVQTFELEGSQLAQQHPGDSACLP